jgi:hypothetical protein
VIELLQRIRTLSAMRPLDVRSKLDDALLGVFNARNRLREAKLSARMHEQLSRNAALRGRHAGERCYIIGNGPSLRDQDLTLLRDEHTFVVNRFIHHPQAESINPTYYCIVDWKFAGGRWGTDFADQISRRLPRAELFLTLDGLEFCEASRLCEANTKHVVLPNQLFHFGYSREIDLTRGIPGGDNVTKVALAVAVYMGFQEINLVGIDGNGLILPEQSHFYGHEPPPDDQLEFEKALVSMSLGLRSWRAIAQYLQARDIRLVSRNPRSVLRALEQGPFPHGDTQSA